MEFVLLFLSLQLTVHFILTFTNIDSVITIYHSQHSVRRVKLSVFSSAAYNNVDIQCIVTYLQKVEALCGKDVKEETKSFIQIPHKYIAEPCDSADTVVQTDNTAKMLT